VLEARDASGIGTPIHAGIMAVPNSMLGGFGVVGALALIAAVFAIRRGGGIGWTLGVFAALVALVGIAFVAFALWGRYAGMPWTFLPVGG